VAPGANVLVDVSCGPGEFLLNGGFSQFGAQLQVTDAASPFDGTDTSPPTRFRVLATNPHDTQTGTLIALARCLRPN